MAYVMTLLNTVIGAALAALLWPFQAWPIAGLAAVSLVCAALVLLVFRAVSNQRALAVSKRRMQAGLFELRLFQDDPAIVLRVVGALCREQVSYLRHALAPMLVIGLPLALLLVHLHLHYGYAGLRPGVPAIVTVRLKALPAAGASSAASARTATGASSAGNTGSTSSASDTAGAIARANDPGCGTDRPRLTLAAPDGLHVDTPCVWAASLREAAWRVTPARDGTYDLRVTWDGGEPLAKRVQVSPRSVLRAPVRPAPTAAAQLLNPGESPLPSDSPIEAIEILYPPGAIDVAGLPLHWVVIFLLLSAAFTLVLRPVFGVVL